MHLWYRATWGGQHQDRAGAWRGRRRRSPCVRQQPHRAAAECDGDDGRDDDEAPRAVDDEAEPHLRRALSHPCYEEGHKPANDDREWRYSQAGSAYGTNHTHTYKTKRQFNSKCVLLEE